MFLKNAYEKTRSFIYMLFDKLKKIQKRHKR